MFRVLGRASQNLVVNQENQIIEEIQQKKQDRINSALPEKENVKR